MDKKILNEVYRLQSLMGVKKQLVMEAPTNPKPFAEFMADFFRKLASQEENEAKSILGDFFYNKLGRVMDEDLFTRIKNGQLASEITEVQAVELRNTIRALMNGSKSTLYKRIFTPILQQSIKEKLPQILQYAMDELSSKINIAENKIRNISDAAQKEAEENLADKFYREEIDRFEKEYPGIKEGLTEEIEKIIGRSLTRPLKDISTFTDIWDTIYRNLQSTELEAFIQNIVKWRDTLFKNHKKLIEELKTLEKQIKETYDQTGVVNKSKLARATAIIFNLRDSVGLEIKTIVQDCVNKKYISEEFANQIKNSDRFIEWMEAGQKYIVRGETKASGWGLTFTFEEAKAALKAVYGVSIIAPFLKNLSREEGVSYGKAVFKDIFEGFKRSLSFLLTQSAVYPSERIIIRNSIGVTKVGLLGSLAYHRLVDNSILPAYLSVISLMIMMLGEAGEVLTGKDFVDWGKHEFGEEFNPFSWVWDKFLELNDEAIWDLFQKEDSAHGNIFMWWTKMDEVWDLLAVGNNEDARKKLEQLRGELQDLIDKNKDDIKNLEGKTQAELQELKTKWEEIKRKCLDNRIPACDLADETIEEINKRLGNNEEQEDNNNNNNNQDDNNTPTPNPSPTESYPHQKEFEDFLKAKGLTPNSTKPYDKDAGVYYDGNSKEYYYGNNQFIDL